MVHTRQERLENDKKYNSIILPQRLAPLQGRDDYVFESFQRSLAFVILDDEGLRLCQITFFCLRVELIPH